MFELVPDVHQSGLWRSWVEKSLGLNFCRNYAFYAFGEIMYTREKSYCIPRLEATWQARETRIYVSI